MCEVLDEMGHSVKFRDLISKDPKRKTLVSQSNERSGTAPRLIMITLLSSIPSGLLHSAYLLWTVSRLREQQHTRAGPCGTEIQECR